MLTLSNIMSVALRAPSAPGMKVIPSVQVVLGATVVGIAPHVPVPLRAYAGSDGTALDTTSG